MRGIFLAFFLLFASTVEASWTVISSACANRFTLDGAATTAAIDTTGADLIVGWAGQGVGFTHVVEDSELNTVVILDYETVESREYAAWYIESPTTDSAHTFSSTNSAGGGATISEAVICVMALSGSHSTAFDVQNGNANQSSATIQPGSVTPTTDGQILITGAISMNELLHASPIDSGFTVEASSDNASSEIAIAYLIQGTAAAINPTWTASATPTAMVTTIASFKVAAASSSTARRRIISE